MATQKFTAQELIDACENSGGIQAIVAKKLGCDRSTVSRYVRRYKTVREALSQADEHLTDLAEGKTIEFIKAGFWPAIRYRLSTKGKARGYTERQEITGTDGGPMEHTFTSFERTLKRVYGNGEDDDAA